MCQISLNKKQQQNYGKGKVSELEPTIINILINIKLDMNFECKISLLK